VNDITMATEALEVKVPIHIKNVHMRVAFKLTKLFLGTAFFFAVRNEFDESVRDFDNPLDIMIVFNQGKNGVIVSFDESSDAHQRKNFLDELRKILSFE
jgi:hypothetical protein